MFQQSSIPLTLSDPSKEDGALVKVNESFSRLTGYAPAECVGRNCRFLQGDDRQQDARLELRKSLEKQEDTEAVLRNYTRSGAAFDNLLFIHHIRDARGAVVCILGSQFAIRDRSSASTLDAHLVALDRNYAALAKSHQTVQVAAKRQVSATVSTLLHSAVLHRRLSDWLKE